MCGVRCVSITMVWCVSRVSLAVAGEREESGVRLRVGVRVRV